jgi:hypothetical protein
MEAPIGETENAPCRRSGILRPGCCSLIHSNHETNPCIALRTVAFCPYGTLDFAAFCSSRYLNILIILPYSTTHNPKVASSNCAPAIMYFRDLQSCGSLFYKCTLYRPLWDLPLVSSSDSRRIFSRMSQPLDHASHPAALFLFLEHA